jgi:two-component system cell cycle sensor histidine kinase/response regulator CckA
MDTAPSLTRGMRAIVVDDEDPVRRIACRFLERAGFEVAAASSASEALALAPDAGSGWNLAVVDLTMPDCDGAELARRLRDRDPNLPVLLVSGYDESEAPRVGLTDAPTGFLQKPFASRDLLAAIEGLIGITR